MKKTILFFIACSIVNPSVFAEEKKGLKKEQQNNRKRAAIGFGDLLDEARELKNEAVEDIKSVLWYNITPAALLIAAVCAAMYYIVSKKPCGSTQQPIKLDFLAFKEAIGHDGFMCIKKGEGENPGEFVLHFLNCKNATDLVKKLEKLKK